MAIRRNYPIVWTDHDFDDLRNELMNRFDRLMTSPLLPTGNFAERIVPTLLGELRVDVAEQENEVIIVADLPGVEKENVEISLVNPRTLEIRCERKHEKEEKEEGYYLRERRSGVISRVIPLPGEVTDQGATATFRNGVLEVHFKKITIERGKKIKID
jgi:HSP20 family protein